MQRIIHGVFAVLAVINLVSAIIMTTILDSETWAPIFILFFNVIYLVIYSKATRLEERWTKDE